MVYLSSDNETDFPKLDNYACRPEYVGNNVKDDNYCIEIR